MKGWYANHIMKIWWCANVLCPIFLPSSSYSSGSCRAFPDILGISDHRCIFFLFFASLHGFWDLICPPRDGNPTACSGSTVLAFGVPAKLWKNWHLLIYITILNYSIYIVSRGDVVGALLRRGPGLPAAMTTGSWWLTAALRLQASLQPKRSCLTQLVMHPTLRQPAVDNWLIQENNSLDPCLKVE